MKVAFYTAGTIGAGHLVFGLAIENGLLRDGFRGEYRMFAPPHSFKNIPTPKNYTTVFDTEEVLADPKKAMESSVAKEIIRYQPDLLLIDLFWAPLYYILPDLKCPKWLFLRWVPPVWLAGPPGRPFLREHFNRVIATEPFSREGIDDEIDPVVICNPDECHPPEALREKLGVSDDQPITMIMQAGLDGEAEIIREQSGEEAVFTTDLFSDSALFPAAKWLGGADSIFCGAGYASFWEARWLGYFDRTVFSPFDRPIDNQSWRVKRCSSVPMEENGADTISWLIGKG